MNDKTVDIVIVTVITDVAFSSQIVNNPLIVTELGKICMLFLVLDFF